MYDFRQGLEKILIELNYRRLFVADSFITIKDFISTSTLFEPMRPYESINQVREDVIAASQIPDPVSLNVNLISTLQQQIYLLGRDTRFVPVGFFSFMRTPLRPAFRDRSVDVSYYTLQPDIINRLAGRLRRFREPGVSEEPSPFFPAANAAVGDIAGMWLIEDMIRVLDLMTSVFLRLGLGFVSAGAARIVYDPSPFIPQRVDARIVTTDNNITQPNTVGFDARYTLEFQHPLTIERIDSPNIVDRFDFQRGLVVPEQWLALMNIPPFEQIDTLAI